MRFATLLSVPTVLAVAATTAGATTWHVPGDASSIQGGINLASAGDTVLVACGTYHEREIDLKSGVRLMSQARDWTCVTIEGDFLGAVLVGEWDTGSDTTELVGLTITEGYRGSYGGVVLDCGGLVRFRKCRIAGNVGDGVYGSTTHSGQSNAGFDSCEVSQNGGTGVSFESGDPESRYVFANCDIRSNQTGVRFMWEGYDPEFYRCRIVDNADAGVRGWMADPTFDECVIAENGGAGLVFDDSGDLTLIGCTVTENGGDGIQLGMEMGYCSADLDHCVIAFNGDYAVDCGNADSPGTASLQCCDVYGNAGGDYVDMYDVSCVAAFAGVGGNISTDPLFCDAEGGDFRIDCSSPCLNAPGCGLIGALGAGCNSTGVVGVDDAPRSYELSANWPNPFNPSTSIRFVLPERVEVELTLYDTAGRRVAQLTSGTYEAGEHMILWNGLDDSGRQAPSGTYFARLHAGEYGDVRKMVLLR